MTQANVLTPVPVRPTATIVLGDEDIIVSRIPPHALDISDYQSKKKLYDYQILNQNENQNKAYALVWPQCTESMHAKIISPFMTIFPLKRP